jgi:hypothetical protein
MSEGAINALCQFLAKLVRGVKRQKIAALDSFSPIYRGFFLGFKRMRTKYHCFLQISENSHSRITDTFKEKGAKIHFLIDFRFHHVFHQKHIRRRRAGTKAALRPASASDSETAWKFLAKALHRIQEGRRQVRPFFSERAYFRVREPPNPVAW